MTSENGAPAAAPEAAADAVTARQVALGFAVGLGCAIGAGTLSRSSGDRLEEVVATAAVGWLAGFAVAVAWPKIVAFAKWLLGMLPMLLILGIVGGILWGIGSWLFAIPSWAAVIVVLLVLVVLK